MRASDAFPSAYLKVDDLKGKRARCEIESVSIETLGDDECPVATFKNTSKKLVLNKTNFNEIVNLTGEPDSDNWTGAAIVLMPSHTEFQGKRVPCIRLDPNHRAWPADRTTSGMTSVASMARDASETVPATTDDEQVAELSADDITF